MLMFRRHSSALIFGQEVRCCPSHFQSGHILIRIPYQFDLVWVSIAGVPWMVKYTVNSKQKQRWSLMTVLYVGVRRLSIGAIGKLCWLQGSCAMLDCYSLGVRQYQPLVALKADLMSFLQCQLPHWYISSYLLRLSPLTSMQYIACWSLLHIQ